MTNNVHNDVPINYIKRFYANQGVHDCAVISMQDIYDHTFSTTNIRPHSNVIVYSRYTDTLTHDLFHAITFGLDYNIKHLYFCVDGINTVTEPHKWKYVSDLMLRLDICGKTLTDDAPLKLQRDMIKYILQLDSVYYTRSIATMLRNTTVDVPHAE